MAQYAIAFDVDTKAMRLDKKTDSDITNLYQKEIPAALESCGFPVHIQGSVYRTDTESNQLSILVALQSKLRTKAPTFCKYVKVAHIFRVEEQSEITGLISTAPQSDTPDLAQ